MSLVKINIMVHMLAADFVVSHVHAVLLHDMQRNNHKRRDAVKNVGNILRVVKEVQIYTVFNTR